MSLIIAERKHPTGVAYVRTHTGTWPELAIGLYESLTEKKAEIAYHFEDMKVEIPSGTGPEAHHALSSTAELPLLETTSARKPSSEFLTLKMLPSE
jgi:hypothetical protein